MLTRNRRAVAHHRSIAHVDTAESSLSCGRESSVRCLSHARLADRRQCSLWLQGPTRAHTWTASSRRGRCGPCLAGGGAGPLLSRSREDVARVRRDSLRVLFNEPSSGRGIPGSYCYVVRSNVSPRAAGDGAAHIVARGLLGRSRCRTRGRGWLSWSVKIVSRRIYCPACYLV